MEEETASVSTVNGEDDLERRRRERREARLKAGGGGDTEESSYSSRRSRRRGTEEDITETPTYNDTSATDTTDSAAAEAAAKAAREEQRRKQREEEEEEARRQQEKEEAEERRRQEQAEARRREEEEDRRREEERIRRKQEADAEFEALEAEFAESGWDDVRECEKQRNVLEDSLHPNSVRLPGVDDRLDNSHVTDKSHATDNVVEGNKDRGNNAKEGKPLQRRRSNSFDKENRRISSKINKFQNLETDAKGREKDRNANYLLHKDGTKNKVEKFEKEIDSQDSPTKKDNSVRSPRFKEVNLIVKKVNEKLQQFEVKVQQEEQQNVQPHPQSSPGSGKALPSPKLRDIQEYIPDTSTETKKHVLDRWKSPGEKHKVSASAYSPKGWNTFSKRLSGNTEFITSRFIERAKESSGNAQTSPRTNVLERSPSFSHDKSVQRSRSQTQADSSSATGNNKTVEKNDSDTHHYQTPSDSSSATGYETPDGKFSDVQQHQQGDYKSSESKSSTTQHYYDAETADTSWKSSKSNSAVHSRGSSYDYDNSYTYSGTSSNEEEARLEQERLEEERQRQEEAARMAADEEKKKKKGKRKGLGGLSPEKKKKLKEISFIDYDTEEEEEKWRVVSERLTPLPDDFENLSTADLKKLCKQLHDKLAQFEGEVYDWEFKCEKQELEVNELTLKVNDSKGKFVKPVLRKTNKTESKFAKIKKNKQKIEDFRDQLKSTDQSKHEEEQAE